MHRRQFLQSASLFTASSLISGGLHGWIVKYPTAAQAPRGRFPRLIVILLRGGVDGLNVVVPYREEDYYEVRPSIAIPEPGTAGGALDLDGQFGLHPALADLMPLWKAGQLAFVHASGSPDPSRSHFDAQDYMETGTPGRKGTPDGWLNRLLALLPDQSPTQAINLGNTTPLIFTGSHSVANLPLGPQARRSLPLDRPATQTAFDRLYSGQDALSQAYQQGRQVRDIVMADLNTEMMESARGAPLPQGFSQDAQRLAQLFRGKTQPQIAFLALGGWDTHVNQGSSQGQLARQLQPLGQGLAQLVRDLGPMFADTTVVVMSEFGRTVQENGNRGTDHGHGNVLWVLGGQIQGGQVYGPWPGLESAQRYQGRDLAVTTDFRAVIASVLTRHLGLTTADLTQIFPGYTLQTQIPLVKV